MKVFISWSGERSEALARVLRDWLPLVLHYVEPWLSQADISAGDRWGIEVAKELDESTFGITCITNENISAPWLLFEAGALAKSMQEGRVVPLLLDIDFRDIAGPLAQFQAKKVERSGIWDTVCSINKICPVPVADARLTSLFEALWPDFEKQIDALPKHSAPTKPSRSQVDILEDLVSGVRNMEMRFRDVVEEDSGFRKYPRSKLRSMMIDEMLHRFVPSEADSVGVLIAASIFRDEIPWVYELGIDLYRALNSRRPSEIIVAHENLAKGMEFVRRGPYFDGPGIDRRAVHFLMSKLEQISESMRDIRFASGAKPARVRQRPSNLEGGGKP